MIVCEKEFYNSLKIGRKLICDRVLIFGETWFAAMTPLVIHEVNFLPGHKDYIHNIIVAPVGWEAENKFYLNSYALSSDKYEFGIIKE